MTADVDWRGQGVLVTGAQGFVGSWLTERLLDRGARVVALQRDCPPGSRFRLEGLDRRCEIVRADLVDYEALIRAINEHEVKSVFHLAAQAIVATANRSPLSTFESNVRGTYVLLEACRAVAIVGAGIERVVVASSDKAYGEGERPYVEDQPLAPLYPYDVSKACADLVARCYATAFDMPVAVTRLANVYGGGDLNFSRIVPDTARALVEGRRPVIRSDGTPERDYLYVEDAVDAYLAVATSLSHPGLRGRAWNAGPERAVSVLELVRMLVASSGVEVEPEVRGTGAPVGEIHYQHLDSARIRRELGWAPRWELEAGLQATYEWYERTLS